jgi:outer membrane lipoprotein LolB
VTRPGLAIAALLVVAGCRTTPLHVPVTDWPSERAARQSLDRWEMSGRAGVKTGSDGFTASLHWIQQGSTSEARIQGALGVGGLRVLARDGTIEIDTSKGEHIGPDEAAAELEKAIGFDLPVLELRYWLLGVPAPGLPANEELDEQGRLVRLSQQDWNLTFDRFENVRGSWLPGRIKLERGAIRVRLVADKWQL